MVRSVADLIRRGRKSASVLLASLRLQSRSFQRAFERERSRAARARAATMANFNPNQRQYRQMTEHDKKKTVFMRYGSLTNFRRIRMGHAAIGKHLKIGKSTIRHFLKAFVAKGCSFQRLGHSVR